MQGSSRGAFAQAHAGLQRALGADSERQSIADELHAVVDLLDGNAPLRRAVTDPTREGSQKAELVRRLLQGKVSATTVEIVAEAAAQRWQNPSDLGIALEQFAAEVALRAAAEVGAVGQVEDELFRFGRIVAGEPSLRSALTDPNADSAAKAALVDKLLDGKVHPVTGWLLRRAAATPRGHRFDRVVEEQLAVAARMQEQLTAVVTVARPLDAEQHERLARALRAQYDKAVQLNVVVDPSVLGGIKVEVEDEVINGTISAKLDDARRRLTAG